MSKYISVHGPSGYHPYECTHDKDCIHCTNKVTESHIPSECWLCCDGDPEDNKPIKLVETHEDSK